MSTKPDRHFLVYLAVRRDVFLLFNSFHSALFSVRALEKAKAAGTYINKSSIMENNVSTTVQYGASDSDNSDLEVKMSKRKRLKTAR